MIVKLSNSIKNQCYNFTMNYIQRNIEESYPIYIHNGEWKETNNELKKITKNIFNVL
jgi:hypothetical protein